MKVQIIHYPHPSAVIYIPRGERVSPPLLAVEKDYRAFKLLKISSKARSTANWKSPNGNSFLLPLSSSLRNISRSFSGATFLPICLTYLLCKKEDQ